MTVIRVTFLAFLLAACVSPEGSYTPDCIAYAGSNIELRNGRFVWEKFTDVVKIDEDGRTINQFPGYPLQGSYRIDGDALLMVSDAGEPLENMYLRRIDDRQYLLTAREHEAWRKTGELANCPLLLGGNSGN